MVLKIKTIKNIFVENLKLLCSKSLKKKIACEREKNHEILLTDIFGPYHPNKVEL